MKSVTLLSLFAATIVSVIACEASSITPSEMSQSAKPFANIQELQAAGVPSDGFSMTMFTIDTDLIEFTYYTNGDTSDHDLIAPAIEQAEQLTSLLRSEYLLKLTFIDGNPMMTVNDQPVGTGEVIRSVVLDKGS